MESERVIRLATIADIPGVARVHVDSWREIYRGIVPDVYLEGLSYERREQMWRSGLENPGWKGVLFVAEDPGHRVVGFVAGGPPQEPVEGFDCELWAIYLLQVHQGQGVGRQLFRRFVEEMVQRGHGSMFLWVLAENPTVGFYQRLGGVKVGEKEIEVGGKKLVEWSYGWRNLGVNKW
ncbi:GNAT family N-acetyltransferase [uncultured Meiothermus sp.]|jgi:ribosomal protein S18 acetylase RimI-like enzyme|uniref:GNAT family N-acetyltransferase n=1 Tax=uncultured Meiothermus sp. TaxID=157471 RepID=UPI00261DD9B5|nr:GNAT family N-acetyltransferase [uncultured Meiothermus sp.]